MLKKLLKHDLKNIFSMWWIALAVFAVFTLVACVCAATYRNATELLDTSYSTFPREQIDALEVQQALCGLVLITYVSALSLFSLSAALFPAIRYFRNFYTDEGYLTFTLPVKVSSLYRSKFISAYLVLLICLGLRLAAVFGVGLLMFPIESFEEQSFLLFTLADLYGFIPGEPWFVYLLQVISELAEALLFVSLWQLSIDLGSLRMNRNRVMLSVLLFIAFSIGVGFAEGTFSSLWQSVNPLFGVAQQEIALVLGGTVLPVIFRLTVFWAFHMISLYLLEKRLNLM